VRVLSRPEDKGVNASSEISLVELTGGEPLLQPETSELAERLLAAGYTVLAETSGERPIDALPREVVKIMDVKCPDSGEFGTFRAENLDALSANDEVKFVLASRRDYEFARDLTRQHDLNRRVRLEPRELADWILADALPVRLGLQLHKFIWDPAMRGV